MKKRPPTRQSNRMPSPVFSPPVPSKSASLEIKSSTSSTPLIITTPHRLIKPSSISTESVTSNTNEDEGGKVKEISNLNDDETPSMETQNTQPQQSPLYPETVPTQDNLNAQAGIVLIGD